MKNYIKNKDGWFEVTPSENIEEPLKKGILESNVPKTVSDKLSELVPQDAEFISFSAGFNEDKNTLTGSVVFRRKKCAKCATGSLNVKTF